MDVPEIVVVSASLGGFDAKRDHVEQSVPCDFVHFTDENFPPRSKSMTSRLQARIVKMFMWQMVPDYEYYLWVDSSCVLSNKDSVAWFLERLGGADIAVFKHPHRKTVQEEADYLKHRLSINCPYITPRYENELIDEQLDEVEPQQQLYASTAFICRNNERVRKSMKDWWFHTSRYHSIDQLSLPFVLFDNEVKVNVIPDNYLKCDYLEHVRKK